MLASNYVNLLSGNFQSARSACTIAEDTSDLPSDLSADDGTSR